MHAVRRISVVIVNIGQLSLPRYSAPYRCLPIASLAPIDSLQAQEGEC